MSMLSPSLQQMAPLSDEELVGRIVLGDVAVFELLMRRHNQRLFRVARAVVKDSALAEDIVQETYLRAYANLSRFEGRSSVATWLSRIAFHEALRVRRKRKRARLTGSFDPQSLQATLMSPPAEDPVVKAETRAMLKTALDALPAQMRAIVMLRLVEGLSTRETAESLHLTESNVKVILHRARRLMFDAMEKGTIEALRAEFTFGATRCDHIVEAVFARLGVGHEVDGIS